MDKTQDDCRGQRITLLEIILDECGLTFGQGACTATGEPCYNNFNNCKDKCNITCVPKSYWFSSCEVPTRILTNYVTAVSSISCSPSSLEIGKTYSTRNNTTITLNDIKHNDFGFDPYWPRGDVIPICPEDMCGTLFGRWIERVKYFSDRKVNLYRGFSDLAFCDFVKESFLIESFSEPDSSGTVKLVLTDILKATDENNSKCPESSNKIVATRVEGNEFALPVTLGTKLDGLSNDEDEDPYAEVGNFILNNNFYNEDEKQNIFFSRLKRGRIGSEHVGLNAEFNTAAPAGWNVRLQSRGDCGTEIKAHDAGAKIQLCESFCKEHVADVVCHLLEHCTNLEAIGISCCDEEMTSLIDYDSIEEYRCKAPLNYVAEVDICKPEGTSKLLKELSEQFLFSLYQDFDTGKITMKHFAPPDCDQTILTIKKCDIAPDTFSRRRNDEQYNIISMFYSPIDCSKAVSEENSNAEIRTVDSDVLLKPCKRRKLKLNRVKKIVSRWYGECNEFVAIANGERLLKLKSCPQQQVSFDVSFNFGKCLRMSDFVRIENDLLQNMSGKPALDVYWYIKSKKADKNTTQITAERTPFNSTWRCGLSCEPGCETVRQQIDPCDPEDCIGIW